MIYLFTDFGLQDWYVGQMHAVLAREAPGVPVINLMHGVAPFDVQVGAYLLSALAGQLSEASITVGVVDPGVGGARRPIVIEADGRWFIGPDNGLFAQVWRRAKSRRAYRIDWRPESLSNSFHGRDLFAPVAAMLAGGQKPAATEIQNPVVPAGWPDDLWRVIHIDRYGNAVTGIGGTTLGDEARMEARGHEFTYAPSFSLGPPGAPFWYRNSINLVELSFPNSSATTRCGLMIGDRIVEI